MKIRISAIALFLILAALCNLAPKTHAIEPIVSKNESSVQTSNADLAEAYEELCNFIYENGLPADISWEDFEEYYWNGNFSSIEDYINEYYSVFGISDGTTGSTYTLSRNN